MRLTHCCLSLSWRLSVVIQRKIVYAGDIVIMMHNLPMYCSASEMFTVNRVSDCKAVILNMVHRFMMRLTISKHLLVRSILSSDLVCSSRIRRPVIVCPLTWWMVNVLLSLVLYLPIVVCLWTTTLYDYVVLYCEV